MNFSTVFYVLWSFWNELFEFQFFFRCHITSNYGDIWYITFLSLDWFGAEHTCKGAGTWDFWCGGMSLAKNKRKLSHEKRETWGDEFGKWDVTGLGMMQVTTSRYFPLEDEESTSKVLGDVFGKCWVLGLGYIWGLESHDLWERIKRCLLLVVSVTTHIVIDEFITWV